MYFSAVNKFKTSMSSENAQAELNRAKYMDKTMNVRTLNNGFTKCIIWYSKNLSIHVFI